jgi:hypothetical protein
MNILSVGRCVVLVQKFLADLTKTEISGGGKERGRTNFLKRSERSREEQKITEIGNISAFREGEIGILVKISRSTN